MQFSKGLKTALTTVLTVFSLSACDVETFDDAVDRLGNNPPPTVPPPPAPPPPPPPPPPSGFNPVYSEIQANVFTPTCATSNCHAGANPDEGLNLTSGIAYAALVGVNSVQEPGIQLVNPGNPNESYLIQKMEGTAAGGDVMPPGGAIDQASINTIRQWIINGAQDDTVVVLDPVQVQSVTPIPNASLDMQPAQLVATFTREVVANSVNDMTFILESSAGDGSFVDGTVTPIPAASITIPIGNPRAAIFDLGAATLADDIYRITLVGSGGTPISDIDANALDGEYLGIFPSGNGTAGGDYQSFFTITSPVVVAPTLADIQANVFDVSCSTGCHNGVGGALPGVMDLSSANASYLALVGAGGAGVPSIQQPAVLRVAPADPDMSYLIRKLEGTAGITGGSMPPGAPLDQTVIDSIRQWIMDGANP